MLMEVKMRSVLIQENVSVKITLLEIPAVNVLMDTTVHFVKVI